MLIKSIMGENEPLWMQVLQFLYEAKGNRLDNKFAHEFADEVPDEFNTNYESYGWALGGLESVGLIQRSSRMAEVNTDVTIYNVELTEFGFQVAHDHAIRRAEAEREEARSKRERNQSKRQHRQNRAIVSLTLGLLLTGAFQTIATIWDNLILIWNGVLTALIIISVFFIAVWIFKSDMLASYQNAVE